MANITRGSWDVQLAKVTEIQGRIEGVKGFAKSVDDAIFGIQLSGSKDGGIGMLKAKEAKQPR